MEKNEKLQVSPLTKRKHRWAFPLGLSITVLAIIGAITLVSLGVNGIKKVADKTELKREYAIFIKNVIRNDPSTYDDISKADMSQLLDSAVWDLIRVGNLDAGKYTYSENEPIGYRIPQEDIEYCFIRLFGSEIKPEHNTVNGVGYTFTYDAVTKEYTIPVTGVSPIYVPEVYNIDKKGSSIILTVGFKGYGEWNLDDLGWNIDPDPVKIMKITLRERKTDKQDIPPYYVGALQATDATDIAVSTATPPTTDPPVTKQVAQTSESTQIGDTTENGETDDNTSTSAANGTTENAD